MLKEGDIRLTYYKEQIEKLENFDYELKGCTGYCFVEDKEIIKIYLEPIHEDYLYDMSKNKSSKIAFPKFYIKKRDKYYAEVMDFLPYKQYFYALIGSVFIKQIADNYKVMINEIKKFPYIYMSDIDFHGNILYDEASGFYLIDTTNWKEDSYFSFESKNIKMFNKALFNGLKLYLYGDVDDYIFAKEIREQYQGIRNINAGKELLEILESSLNCEFDFIAFLNAYNSTVKVYCNDNIKTTEDMKKYIKIMKNS